MPNLETPRLRLVTFGPMLVQAALEDRVLLAGLLGTAVHVEWPNADFAEVLPEVLQGQKTHPESIEWSAIILDKKAQVLIGDIGFYGPPDEEGSVNIGYGIVPSYRGQGYATEALSAMIEWAIAQANVQRVLADCEAWNVGSVRALEKVGMQKMGEQDGLICWQLAKSADPLNHQPDH